jgi:hypothetical protein
MRGAYEARQSGRRAEAGSADRKREAMSSRRRAAPVGIYCRPASSLLGGADPDTRSVRSLLRDDKSGRELASLSSVRDDKSCIAVRCPLPSTSYPPPSRFRKY